MHWYFTIALPFPIAFQWCIRIQLYDNNVASTPLGRHIKFDYNLEYVFNIVWLLETFSLLRNIIWKRCESKFLILYSNKSYSRIFEYCGLHLTNTLISTEIIVFEIRNIHEYSEIRFWFKVNKRITINSFSIFYDWNWWISLHENFISHYVLVRRNESHWWFLCRG